MSETVKEIEELLEQVPPLTDLGPRKMYEIEEYASSYDSAMKQRMKRTLVREKADLVSSEVVDGKHAPVLDFDFPCQLVPSGTPGHFHLYIDKTIPWKSYEKLLKVLAEVGLIESGFYRMAMERKATYVRLPEKPKGSEGDKPTKMTHHAYPSSWLAPKPKLSPY